MFKIRIYIVFYYYFLFFFRTTKLVVAYFRENGHKSFKTLIEESKLVLDPPPNIPSDVWCPFNPMVVDFFAEFGRSRLDQNELNSEVTSLIRCFVGVGLTYDKLIETFSTQRNFEDNLAWRLEVITPRSRML